MQVSLLSSWWPKPSCDTCPTRHVDVRPPPSAVLVHVEGMRMPTLVSTVSASCAKVFRRARTRGSSRTYYSGGGREYS